MACSLASDQETAIDALYKNTVTAGMYKLSDKSVVFSQDNLTHRHEKLPKSQRLLYEQDTLHHGRLQQHFSNARKQRKI